MSVTKNVEGFKNTVVFMLILAIPAFVMGIFGYVAALFLKKVAHSAVIVRPELAEVIYRSSLLTNHGVDWVFYIVSLSTIGGLIIGIFLLLKN